MLASYYLIARKFKLFFSFFLKIYLPRSSPFRYMYKKWAHRVTLSHDSYSCLRFEGRDLEVRPFPTRRREREEDQCNFVGAPCSVVEGEGIRSSIDTNDPKKVGRVDVAFFKKI